MILIAIVAVVIIFLAIGTAMNYYSHRDDVSQKQEVSNIIQNDRIKEQLAVSRNDTHLFVANQWGGETSNLQAIGITCDDGRVFTTQLEINITSLHIANQSKVFEELNAKCG